MSAPIASTAMIPAMTIVEVSMIFSLLDEGSTRALRGRTCSFFTSRHVGGWMMAATAE